MSEFSKKLEIIQDTEMLTQMSPKTSKQMPLINGIKIYIYINI